MLLLLSYKTEWLISKQVDLGAEEQMAAAEQAFIQGTQEVST